MQRLLSCMLVAGSLYIVIALADSSADDHGMPHAVGYDSATFTAGISHHPHFIMFYAPWCGHCKQLALTFNLLADKYNIKLAKELVTIAKVDCTQQKALCANNNVRGYPTLLFFAAGNSVGVAYTGARDLNSLQSFVEDKLNIVTPKDDVEEEDAETVSFRDHGDVLEVRVKSNYDELTVETFHEFISSDGPGFVMFYSPDCAHCKAWLPTWYELAAKLQTTREVRIAMVNCIEYSDLCTDQKITHFPTHLLYKSGEMMDRYEGANDVNTLLIYVTQMKSMTVGQTHPVSESVVQLTEENYDKVIKTHFVFINFYKPWCEFCQSLAPVWADLGEKYANQGSSFVIASVNCVSSASLCSKNEIEGYPTLMLFERGRVRQTYTGLHQLESLAGFLAEYSRHVEL